MTRRLPIEEYIANYWKQASVTSRHNAWGNLRNLVMHVGRIPLPHTIVSPNHTYFAGTQYYWDTYFTVVGLIESGETAKAKGMVDNLLFLFQKFGYVPARNSWTSFGRSQPPLLTRMAWEVYESGVANKTWLDKVMRTAISEYERTWASGRRLHAPSGLSRYRPLFLKKMLTTYESGWDVSSRFAHERTSCLPVDLNSLLYVYEQDIAAWHTYRKRAEEAQKWRLRSQQRAKAMTLYFWDDERGFFYDFDEKAEKRDRLLTLAGFFPLWAKVATKQQAKASVQKLEAFQQAHGLASTEKLPSKHRQWDYPNGWPPLQLVVIEGLLNYGYKTEAKQLIDIWLALQNEVYERTGKLWEKYDVVRGTKGRRGRYPTQPGFAWSNGVYLRLKRLQKAL